MQALSKAKLKLFTSLQAKKYRFRHQMFMLEGWKMTLEALAAHWEQEAILVREDVLQGQSHLLKDLPEDTLWITSKKDFNTLSSQKNPEGILSILRFPRAGFCEAEVLPGLPRGKGLLLEKIQDPGNLGTLIRTADWFGIPQVYCSEGSVDLLNPKALRATMGSLFRVEVRYIQNWHDLLLRDKSRIWVADMEGQEACTAPLAENSWILLGNEANGVEPSTRQIPGMRFISLSGRGHAESLNVGVAGSILMYELAKA